MAYRPQEGQATVVVLAMLSVLLGGMLIVFSTGSLVNDKMKLLNAADAAAFSAAQIEARSLNYQAYINRAIVANEIAIAQLVSLRSWSRYMERTLTNASRVGSFVPPLAPALQALERGWTAVDEVIGRVAPPLESGISRWNVDVLTIAQAVAHQQATLAAADIVAQAAHEVEPRADVTDATRALQVRNAAIWQNRFTTRYQRGGGDLDRFSSLLADARDGFTARRSHDLLPDISPVQVSRRGGTDLLGEYSWRSVDTLSAHINLLITEQEIPLGWGAAEQRRVPVPQRGEHGGSLRRNPRASRIALRPGFQAQGYRGVPEIRDVVQPQGQEERRLTYSVALRIPAERLRTIDRILLPDGIEDFLGGTQTLAPALSARALHGLGSAELYFRRPAERSDGRREYPSLFSPYWQARLVATPATDRILTAPERGLSVDPFAVTP